MASKKYYVVWVGVDPGVYDSWEDAKQQITNYPNARYKAFNSRAEAIEAYRGTPDEYMNFFRGLAQHKPRAVNYDAIPEIIPGSIAVDAACSRNPGPVEYRGVDIATGQQLFHVGPLQQGSNNLGEFLAIVHALAWLEKQGRHNVAIYSDSRTAQAWVRQRRVRTTIAPTPENQPIRTLVARAEAWLQTHTPRNPIIKWETEKWGEIPADFGRK